MIFVPYIEHYIMYLYYLNPRAHFLIFVILIETTWIRAKAIKYLYPIRIIITARQNDMADLQRDLSPVRWIIIAAPDDRKQIKTDRRVLRLWDVFDFYRVTRAGRIIYELPSHRRQWNVTKRKYRNATVSNVEKYSVTRNIGLLINIS